jgi:hypothetical protein
LALEVLVCLAGIQFAVWGIAVPLVDAAHADRPPATRGSIQSSMTDRLVYELTPEGVAEVYGPDAAPPADGHVEVGELTLTPVTTAEVTFAHPGWADIVATTGATLAVGLTGLAVSVILWQVVRSVRRGSPFHRANARRLYAAGSVTLGGGVVWLACAFGQIAVAARDDLDKIVYPSLTLQFGFVAIAAVLVVMAEVFRRGVALQAETEGLV